MKSGCAQVAKESASALSILLSQLSQPGINHSPVQSACQSLSRGSAHHPPRAYHKPGTCQPWLRTQQGLVHLWAPSILATIDDHPITCRTVLDPSFGVSYSLSGSRKQRQELKSLWCWKKAMTMWWVQGSQKSGRGLQQMLQQSPSSTSRSCLLLPTSVTAVLFTTTTTTPLLLVLKSFQTQEKLQKQLFSYILHLISPHTNILQNQYNY